jgi:microcystin-dependent protein
MGQPFIGEIRMFAGTFAPAGWALCNGQMLAISENDALFNLIGTTYGGDGQQTFGLPNLQGRVPIHMTSSSVLGQNGGVETVTLTTQQMPAHTHALMASTSAGTQNSPTGNVTAASPSITLYTADVTDTNMNAAAVSTVGQGGQHDNLMPFLCFNFIISLFGIFPPHN